MHRFTIRPRVHAAVRHYNVAMDIVFNGSAEHLPEGASVLDLLKHADLHERRVAVEVNGEIVPKSLHASHTLFNGDRVEIVHALGGG